MENLRKVCPRLILTVLAAFTAFGTVLAESADGLTEFVQNGSEWFIMHGDNVLFRGSGTPDFSNMPQILRDAVEHFDTVAPVSRAQGRQDTRASFTKTVGPMISTAWTQEAPYNDLMPVIDGKHVPAGCATIATAQVINYYRYCRPWTATYDDLVLSGPVFSHDSITKWYDPSEVICPEPVYNVHYSFDGYSYSMTPAQLCEMVAFGQKARYGKDLTSTFVDLQQYAIQQYFGYDSKYYWTHMFSGMADSLIQQLDMGRPVIVCGNNLEGMGHSFIVDGYNTNGEFHLNLGWGESWNCWSAIENWDFLSNNYIITLFPDPEDKSLYVKESENGTLVFRNTDTGETLRKEMTVTPLTSGATGLMIFNGYMALGDLTAGNYEYCVEYASGKRISADMPAVTDRDTYSYYIRYNNVYKDGTSHIYIPYDCRLTFYAPTSTAYGMQVILEAFDRGTAAIGDVWLYMERDDSTVMKNGKASFSEELYEMWTGNMYVKRYNGTYSVLFENVPAGNYNIFAKVSNSQLGKFNIGVSVASYPCSGNYYTELDSSSRRSYGDYDDWLWYGSLSHWTDESVPYFEPMMIALPESEGMTYTVVLAYESGSYSILDIYARPTDPTGVVAAPDCTPAAGKVFMDGRLFVRKNGKLYYPSGIPADMEAE